LVTRPCRAKTNHEDSRVEEKELHGSFAWPLLRLSAQFLSQPGGFSSVAELSFKRLSVKLLVSGLAFPGSHQTPGSLSRRNTPLLLVHHQAVTEIDGSIGVACSIGVVRDHDNRVIQVITGPPQQSQYLFACV